MQIVAYSDCYTNTLDIVQTDAFRDARIRELHMVDCNLQEISPSAFSGLEATLQLLDLSGNNLTNLPPHLLQVTITLPKYLVCVIFYCLIRQPEMFLNNLIMCIHLEVLIIHTVVKSRCTICFSLS